MKIAMVSSEARPFCKTGGLADVVYSLSKELASMGEDVSIIIPFYSSIKIEEAKKVYTLSLRMAWRTPKVEVFKTSYEGITYYLLKIDQYFARGHLYGDFDDGERFACFTLAAKALLEKFKKAPDIIHVHDWQAGMLPCLIKEENKKLFENTKFIGTIHNPAFQGLYPKIVLGDLYNLPDSLYDSGKVRFKEQVSTLKTMIVYSDKITTVSPTHHLELLTEKDGMGLDSVLRLREYDFDGILNGIDYLEFNPISDKNIVSEFNEETVLDGKKKNKKELLKKFNLIDESAPVFSIVSRITWQKGFDLVFPAVEDLVSKGANIILLGSGESQYEETWENLHRKYPNKVGIYIGYNDPLAHQIYAGSDFFLMPSLFEPCGLGQMIAQRYGTLPIVRRTGGLKDSVINFDGNNLDSSNGFGFDEYSVYEMIRTCNYALDTYKKKRTFNKLVKNAIKTDNSWAKSTKEYLNVYKKALEK